MAKQHSARHCNFPGCESPAQKYYYRNRFKGYRKTCQDHHGYLRRAGPLNPAWKGGRIKGKGGYIKVLDPRRQHLRGANRYILEHRLVMELALGRQLSRTELVHHLNGIRDDNRSENLVVIAGPSGHETWTLHKALQKRIRDLEARITQSPRTS